MFCWLQKSVWSVWHDGLFSKLSENKIGETFYDLIKNLYSKTKCAVELSDQRTPFFSFNRGVRQGCVLSPILFNLYINELPNLIEKANTDPFLLPNHTPVRFYMQTTSSLSQNPKMHSKMP